MVSIRKSFFETNSSSCHALIMSNEPHTLPKTIYLGEDNEVGDHVRAMIRDLDEEDSKKFVHFLYNHGVDTIIYNGSNPFISKYATEYLNLTDEQKEEIKWDNEIPRIRKFCSSHVSDTALINFLLGEYSNYLGHDDELYYGDNKESYIIS